MAFQTLRCRFLANTSVFSYRILNHVKPCLERCASLSFYQSKASFTSQPVNKILAAVCCFGITGGAYAYLTAPTEGKKRNLSTSLVELADPYALAVSPESNPSRKVAGPATLGVRMTLYQYQTCPFCCKVRAFLDYHGIPYNVVEVNPIMKQQLKFSKYRKVPIVLAHDEKSGVTYQLNDSSVIISILGTLLLDVNEKLPDILKLYPRMSYKNESGKEVTEVSNQYFLMHGEKSNIDNSEEIGRERQWRKWADDEFVHVLSPNIYRTPAEALQAFDYFSEAGNWKSNFTAFERLMSVYVGATAMYFIGKKLKKKYGLKDDVRESLYDSCRLWMKNVGKSKFMGGDYPNLADLSVYGLLSSIEGCVVFQDLTKNTNIGRWYYAMKESVKSHGGFKERQMKSLHAGRRYN